MSQIETDPVTAFVLAQTAAGDVADFTRREGYSAENKPVIKAEFLRLLLLGRLEGAKVLHPGVRIVGARIEGLIDLRDCAGDGLAALCLESCDFDDAINLSNSRVARLSLLGSRIRALIAFGLKVDDDVALSGVTALPAPVPIAFVDLRSARISGSIIASDARLAALAQDQNAEGAYTSFALDLSLATVGGGVILDQTFVAEGGVALNFADISGQLQCTTARFADVRPGSFALAASAARIGGAVLLDGASTSGVADFISARIGGNLQCTGATFSNEDGEALLCDQVHIRGGVKLDKFTAKGLVAFNDANIEGSFECYSARLSNKGRTALSAAGAQIGLGVYIVDIVSDGEVTFMNARVDSGLTICRVALSQPSRYAFNLQTARIGGELQAFDNRFEGAVTLSGARIGRLYDIPDTAWTGASAIELNELSYSDLSAQPWFFSADRLHAQQGAAPKPKTSAKRPPWRVRADWLKRNTGMVGDDRCPFSNQPWRECAAALARAGHYSDARRLAREEQREVNRQRAWWKQPFVWVFAEQAFGYGLSVTRATAMSLLFVLLGWAGASAMLQRGILVDARDPQAVKVCTTIDPVVYAVDVAIPVLDLKEESICQPGRRTDAAAPARLPVFGALNLDEVTLWRWAKALYAILGAIVIGFTILTYSGVFKPKADA